MAVFAEIRMKNLGSKRRMDAEYFHPDYIRRAEVLNKLDTAQLGKIALVTDGIHASPVFKSGSNIRYVSAKCVRDCLFDFANAEEIAPGFHETNPRTSLRHGDVIISTVGTIGFCAVVEEWMLPLNCDRHVGIVRIHNPKKYNPYFLAAFINSAFGKNQTIREATGNVQLNLFIYSISKINVPFSLVSAEEIGHKIKNAVILRRKSEELYREASDVLAEEMGINPLVSSEQCGYDTSLSRLLKERRWDSEFYKPKYGNVIDTVLKANKTKVKRMISAGNAIRFITNGHTPLRHDL